MAAEGVKLTSFSCVASSVCTPSRAAFMTGCYPARVSMETSGTRRGVLQPVAQRGLAPGEATVAEILKEQGYAAMCIGKWHLGDQLPFLPTRQGFDGWLGGALQRRHDSDTAPRVGEMWPPVPLLRDEEVIEAPVDPNTLTARYTEQRPNSFVSTKAPRRSSSTCRTPCPAAPSKPLPRKRFARGRTTASIRRVRRGAGLVCGRGPTLLERGRPGPADAGRVDLGQRRLPREKGRAVRPEHAAARRRRDGLRRRLPHALHRSLARSDPRRGRAPRTGHEHGPTADVRSAGEG